MDKTTKSIICLMFLTLPVMSLDCTKKSCFPEPLAQQSCLQAPRKDINPASPTEANPPATSKFSPSITGIKEAPPPFWSATSPLDEMEFYPPDPSSNNLSGLDPQSPVKTPQATAGHKTSPTTPQKPYNSLLLFYLMKKTNAPSFA